MSAELSSGSDANTEDLGYMHEPDNPSSRTKTAIEIGLVAEPDAPHGPAEPLEVPAYLSDVYHWAYLSRRNASLLDRELVVSAILFGQHRRLQRAAFSDIEPGSRVFLPAHVYGGFLPNLAHHLGPLGSLDVADVSATQIDLCRKKVRGFPWVSVCRADARHPRGGPYDTICCYFLLHELPDSFKRSVVDALLNALRPGGKAVFVDYHKPNATNPLRPIIRLVFHLLEPFAHSIWEHSIEEFASGGDAFSWRKEIYFGGLYQKVTATKR